MLRFCLGPRHSTPRRSVRPWDALMSAAAVSCCLTGMPSTSMTPARPAGEQGEQSSTSRGQSPTMDLVPRLQPRQVGAAALLHRQDVAGAAAAQLEAELVGPALVGRRHAEDFRDEGTRQVYPVEW
ncbi:hypothetical protein EYF80_053095 [Liparis tanakae]|uniref:Uncharacterized protein n=1 Tax=Liparis tanakae TaxID=230148 RepID=A0A4Z2F6F1_9TELE|nr:hypothetical protein EYF80_053095 [Liparis tanakae]